MIPAMNRLTHEIHHVPNPYVPNPSVLGVDTCQFVRTKTIGEFTAEIEAAMRALTPNNKHEVGEFEWFGLCSSINYRQNGYTKDSPLPRDAHFIAYCERGGSEGYIVRLGFRQRASALPTSFTHIISGKCWTQDYAWQATRQLAELCDVI